MKNRSYGLLANIIKRFNGKKILIIGDLILDEFIWGKVSRISPEAPVPVVWVKDESFMPGGAANVANNIIALGAEAYVAGVIGNDDHGSILKDELAKKGIYVEGVIADSLRPTTLKTRVIAHHQQVVRIDREKVHEIDDKTKDRLVEYVKDKLGMVDALLIEDYGKGLITPKLLKPIISYAKKKKVIIAVDPKEDHISYYKGVTVITPNHHEASKVTGIKVKGKDSLKQIGDKLLKKLKVNVALVTLGEDGMAVFEHEKKPNMIPTIAQEVYDVSGAGDTVISSYTLSLAAGASPIQAAHIANYAAGIVVGKIGISVIEQDELIKRIKREMRLA